MTRHRSRHPLTVWVPLVVLALVAAACSDDADRASTPTTPVAGDFPAQFSEVCLDIDRQIEGLPDPVGLRSLGDIARQAATITDDGVERLREVEPPDDVATAVDSLVDGLAEQSEIFTRLADTAGSGDRVGVDEISTEGEIARRALAAEADALGIDCGLEGEDGTTPTDDDTGAPASMDPTDAESPTAIPEFGEDPALDALARECSNGDPQACDLLSLSGAPSSGYEEYGATCGGRNESLAGDADTFCIDLYPEAGPAEDDAP